MHVITGTCLCGSVHCEIQLSQPAAACAPRRCDCDFCISRNLQYLSDPKGQLRIQSPQQLLQLQQGSAQAEFLACNQCQTVVAVC